jgi:predicted outer membrane repeat protein
MFFTPIFISYSAIILFIQFKKNTCTLLKTYRYLFLKKIQFAIWFAHLPQHYCKSAVMKNIPLCNNIKLLFIFLKTFITEKIILLLISTSALKNKIMKTIAFFLLFFAMCIKTMAVTYYVTPSGDSTKTGLSWSSPIDLKTALSRAAAKDMIWVKAGTYIPSAKTRNVFFILNSGIALYGGFAGTETGLNQRNSTLNITTLSGNIGKTALQTDNSLTVISITNADNSTILDGFTISGAYSSGNKGGALVIDAISKKTCLPQISNCVFSGNYTKNGSAIYISATSGSVTNPAVSNCSFSNNTATVDGGAIGFLPKGEGQTGGKFTNCIFDNNTASSYGGAIYMDAGVAGSILPTFTDCIFRGNAATYGSAIANFGNNGLINYKLNNCLFAGNISSSEGTIYNSGDFDSSDSVTMTMANCTFSGNMAASGASVYNYAIYGVVNSNIYNSILWNGQSAEVYNIGLAYASIIDYSDTYGSLQTGTGNISADPLFINPVSYNSAPDTAGNYHVANNSPVINSGNNSYNTTVTDLDGNARVQNTTIDMGAYETASALKLNDAVANDIETIMIAPDPVQGNAAIKLKRALNENGELLIADAAGRIILKKNVDKGVNTFSLNMSALMPGIYFVMLKTEEKTIQAKFEKQ